MRVMSFRHDASSTAALHALVLCCCALTACLQPPEPAWDPETTRASVPDAPGSTTAGSRPPARGADLSELFRQGRSDVWVESRGTVVRELRDDLEGSRHQRFIVRVEPSLTVLVSHNIDLAPRVPLRVGDTVAFRGEYEWNDRGGVVHWTHHDPRGRRRGGYLEHRGQRYE